MPALIVMGSVYKSGQPRRGRLGIEGAKTALMVLRFARARTRANLLSRVAAEEPAEFAFDQILGFPCQSVQFPTGSAAEE